MSAVEPRHGGGQEPAAGAARRPIELLPPELIDQIAAGEVVERPASVVKELVENALDAGATHIAVEVEAGGKRLIRVLDNGTGMTGDELRLALQRHATSKLRCLDDLFRLGTMGFRGEALPSIASVSRMSIVSRTREQVAGTRLDLEGGRIVEMGEVGAPVGTRIEVRDLLFNVPARLNFLKGDATEASHVTDAVSRLAMAHPRVHVRLRHGNRTAFDAPLAAEPFERVRLLLGSRMAGRLHPVAGEEGGVVVTAYLAAPELAQTTARGVQLFVGRRSVRDRGLLHAVAMGYGELVPRGRYPVAVVLVEVADGAVDVNVHPQKLEVRFSDPQRVYAAVRHVVRRGVAEAPWLEEPASAGARVRMQAIAQTAPPEPGRRASELAADYVAQQRRMFAPRPARQAREVRSLSFPLGPAADDADRPAPAAAAPPERRALARAAADAPAAVSTGAAPAEGPSFLARLRYLGQLDRTYLVCEAEGELVLLDQHAAHERVEFQRLRERYHQRQIPVQQLLFPQVVELSSAQAAVAADDAGALAAVGFELAPSDAGGGAFAVKAVPAGLRGDATAVLGELLDELGERGGSRAVEDRLDLMLATIACHSVVRAGDVLSPREAEALLQSLDGVDFKAHCPHGRPVLLRISVAEIARRFGR
jgi:DNA mismatch repair protein MutL